VETLRIAILTETLPPAELTLQPWRYLGNLAQALQDEGHDAFVVTSDIAPETWNGIPVKRHGVRDDFRYASGLRQIVHTEGADAGLCRLTATLFFTMRRRPPGSSSPGRLAGVFLRPLHDGLGLARRFLDPALVPEIRLDVHHAGLYASRKLGTWPAAKSLVDAYFFLWESDRRAAISAGLPPSSCSVLRHPFDPFFLEKAKSNLGPQLSEMLGTPSRRIVFAGPPEASRGVPDMLRLVRYLPSDPPTQVLLLLRDSTYPEPRASVIRCGPHTTVVVRGFLSQTEIRSIYLGSDVAVFPYRFVRTALPLVVIEAVAAGLPVVTTRVHPIRELEGNTGLVFVEPRNPRGISEAVRWILDEGGRTEIGPKNRHWIESTPDWKHVARTFASVLREVPAPG
jgi:glycosyltransferase involved in cell wall biosynthesis